jgi:chromosome segregation ATPase
MRSLSIIFSTVLFMVPAAWLSAADSGIESRLREALRTSTQQLNQLQSELADCKRQKDDLDQKIESLEKQAGSAKQCAAYKAKQDALQVKIDKQAEEHKELEASLAECKTTLANNTALEKSQADLAQVKEELTRIKNENTSLAERLKQAEDKNKNMYRVGRDVLDWVSSNWICSEIIGCDVFLGLKRAKLENMAQDYKDKLIEQKLAP